jgi:hypothetical protein
MKKTKQTSHDPKRSSEKSRVKKNNDSSQSVNDEDLPGYPHYRPSDDIMNHQKEIEKIDIEDMDELKTSGSARKSTIPPQEKPVPEEDPIKIVRGTEADVTQEDLELLGDMNLNNDLGDDDLLKRRTQPVDMSGDDLDVPGSELDDDNESIGEEDEENNNYSLGGDRHENLEENSSPENE